MDGERLRVSLSLHTGRFKIGGSKLDLVDLPIGTREATVTPGDYGRGESVLLTLAYYRKSSHVSKRVAQAFLTDSQALSALSRRCDRMRVFPRDNPSPQRIYVYLKGPVDTRVDYSEI